MDIKVENDFTLLYAGNQVLIAGGKDDITFMIRKVIGEFQIWESKLDIEEEYAI